MKPPNPPPRNRPPQPLPRAGLKSLLQFDHLLHRRHGVRLQFVAGVDEVGRGPLAGPVVAAAVILHRTSLRVPIDDSKKLSPRAREIAYRTILAHADVGIGFSRPEEIDRLGIHRASGLAMVRSIQHLPHLPRVALLDGPWIPDNCPCRALPIVDGDAKSFSIACASIVAKVVRDRFMRRLHQILPEYGFFNHKGYGTPEHFKALCAIGPSLFHRYSFGPIRVVDEESVF